MAIFSQANVKEAVNFSSGWTTCSAYRGLGCQPNLRQLRTLGPLQNPDIPPKANSAERTLRFVGFAATPSVAPLFEASALLFDDAAGNMIQLRKERVRSIVPFGKFIRQRLAGSGSR